MLKPLMKNLPTEIQIQEETQKRSLLLASRDLLGFNGKNLLTSRGKNQKELAIKG